MLSNNKKKTRESCFEKETITLKIKELELILSQYDRYFKRKLLDISNISGGVSLLITGLTTEVPRLLLFIGLLPLSVFLIIYGGINLVKDFKDKFSIKSLFQEIVASNIPEVRYDSIFVKKTPLIFIQIDIYFIMIPLGGYGFFFG